MVQSLDLESEETFDILKYKHAGVCSSIKQVELVRNIRKFNPLLMYKSMNLHKYLIVF